MWKFNPISIQEKYPIDLPTLDFFIQDLIKGNKSFVKIADRFGYNFHGGLDLSLI
jgi:hypothetical protein